MNRLRDFLSEICEIPDGEQGKQNLEYSIQGIPMGKKPDPLTKQFIVENAEYSLESSSHHWIAWIWGNIVVFAVSGTWPAQHYPHYFSDFWDIICERRQYWDRVYFIVDANEMPVQSEEFRHYVKTNWQHLIEREDFRLCIVESKAMKRAIWGSIYQLLGIQNRVKMFKDHDRALTWLKYNQIALRENKQD